VSIRIERLVLVTSLLFAFLVSHESHAAPPAFLVGSKTEASPPAPDGLYVQVTAGIGAPQLSITVQDPGHSNYYTDSQSSASLGGSLFLGGPLLPGIALGIGGLATLAPTGDSNVTSSSGQSVHLVDVKQAPLQSMAMVGPFVDIYPSPKLGWHLQGLVGYAWLSPHNFYSAGGPSGIGLMAGVGHDWWLGKHCNTGLLARVNYANARLDPEQYGSNSVSSISEHETLVSPSLEASFTFH